MVNYNTKRKEIIELIRLGYRLLEIIEPDGTSTFYNVDTFDSSVFSTTSSLDYNVLVGKDVTEFLQNTGMIAIASELRSRYEAYLEKSLKMKVDFCNQFKWKLYKID